tara:strand:+ start:2765 stop:3244 length:480 start_codon:yes stop_codon:yes gene_type:complete
MEDKIMRQPGLYLMWTILFVVNLICLSIDSTTGPIRDFNVMAQFLSTIYSLVSSVNNIYGNKLPSTMLLTAGPVHQYTTWLLLAYYRGNVYSSSAIGIYNGVVTVVIGIFTADMVIKTWTVAINPKYYLDYVEKKTAEQKPTQQQQVDVEIVEQKNNSN